MTPEARAFEAKQVLDNPAFVDVMQRIKQAALDGLVSANIADVDCLRSRVAMFQACSEFESALKTQIFQSGIDEAMESAETEKQHRAPWYARVLSRQILA